MSHHAMQREVAPGVWDIARPVRDTNWWHRRRQERACRTSLGHCWHPADATIAWFCCACSADEDGMPPQRCRLCIEHDRQVAELRAEVVRQKGQPQRTATSEKSVNE